MKHTPEPWSYGGAIPTNVWGPSNDGYRVARCDFDGDHENQEAQANARRITACVNHCAGISTEVLEAGPRMDELVRSWKPELAGARALLERALVMVQAASEDHPRDFNDREAEHCLVSALEKPELGL
jgi:hypothetical protein